jgi:hypothetical protein
VIVTPGRYWAVARVRRATKPGPLMPGDRHSGLPEWLEGVGGWERVVDFVVADLGEAARATRKTRQDHFEVEGRVSSADGKPLADRYVTASRCAGGPAAAIPPYVSGWTSGDGRYRLFLPRGCWRLAAAAVFPPAAGGSAAREIEVVGDARDLEVVDGPER